MAEKKILSAAVPRLASLFSGHPGAHGTHGEPTQDPGKLKWEIKSTARTLREPVTPALWEEHLAGKRPLGVISIREDSTCLWGSIDVDRYDADLLDVVERAERHGLPLVPCRSKSGGLHLFLFLSDPQPAGAVQAVLRDAAARLGLAGSEIFPKQTRVLAERGDLGNWMVMPYFGSTYGGKIREQVGVTPGGAGMPLEEFLDAAERARVDARMFELLAARPAGQPNGSSKVVPLRGDFADGPPCLQHLSARGIGENEGRNNALFHMGVYFRRRGPGTWKRDVEDANRRHMHPPLTSDEVAATIRSLEKKDYDYTCKVEPMCSHCDSATCRTRRWGVGGEGDLPTIAGLSKLDTRPAIWFVDVAGVRLELTTEQLYRYELFCKACMEEANHVYGTMRQPQWVALLQEAMANVVTLEAPGEVSVQGRFQEQLEDFLTNRSKGRRIDDLFSGRPWECEDEGRYYFRLQDLQKFLNREDFRDETGRRVGRNKITTMVEKLGGGYRFFNVRQRGLGAWWVPSFVVEHTPTLEPEQVPDTPV